VEIWARRRPFDDSRLAHFRQNGHTKSIEARQQAHGPGQPGSRCYTAESQKLNNLNSILNLSIYLLYNRNKIDKVTNLENGKQQNKNMISIDF
jgi:hypothetical protein